MSAAAGAGTLTVNGDVLPVAGTATIGELLARLEVRPERVVVELNGTIHRRGEGLDQPVQPGDVVEIVHFVGGG
ncbi:MAG: thiazole synthase [Chloroflexota bacterium]|nr:thiazole synthase [Chloroflexota bacterium]